MQDPAIPAGSQPPGDLDASLAELRSLIERERYQGALARSEGLLEGSPEHRDLLYMRAVCLRHLHRLPDALRALETLEYLHPSYARLYQERGHCHVFLRQAPEAIRAFSRAVELDPALPASWRLLASLYGMVGRTRDAEMATRCAARLGELAPEIVTARSMLSDGNLRDAEAVIRGYLKRVPEDIEAMRVLAQVAHQNEFSRDSAVLLEEVLAKAPNYHAARHDYVLALIAMHRHRQAREQLDVLIAAEPGHLGHRITLAGILVGQGSTEEAIGLYRELLKKRPDDPELHVSLAHALKTRGRHAEAVQSYREAMRLRPSFGDAYWSLANLKTYRFPDAEIASMREQLESRRTSHRERYHLCFALGKGLEDRGEYGESFRFYAKGNALKKEECSFRPLVLERTLQRQAEVCTSAFFAERRGYGCDDPAPIFIVGLPRAGSTLLEQIIASHSQVEGTMELADVPRLVGALDQRVAGVRYPDVLASFTAEEYLGFGEAYIRDTRYYRAAGKQFFIDKMPNNFRHVGLIHLMLPNAKIIDARREAMACCFGNFKQLFASGQQFTYSLEDIARYYRMYVRIMEHWDQALPGRVLRVQHEDVIDDLEGSVRRILDHLGLEFEPACVEFHRTDRRVHTASSEQVRRPITREGMDQWRKFEPWLGQLRAELGPLAPG